MRIGLKKFAASAGPSLFLVFNIFLFGPYTIFQGNQDEFSVALTSMLGSLLLPALILLVLLSLAGWLLPARTHRLYVSIVFVLGVLLWLQGNFLVWRYGLLNGQAFDWSIKAWRGWVDGTLWVGLLIVAVLFVGKVYKISAVASVGLTGVLLVSLLFTSLQKPGAWRSPEKSSLSSTVPDEIFEFSAQKNIIQFILDGFQSDIFEEIVAENFDRYSASLEGFTFFREAIGSFPTTYMAVPAFLSGKIYKNQIPMRRFVNQVNRGTTIFNVLHDSGYATDIVGNLLYRRGARYSNYCQIAIPYGGGKREKLKFESSLMIDLVLFRHVPHFLKKFIYNDDLWLVQRLFTKANSQLQIRYFSHRAFLEDLTEHLSTKRDAPAYKYIHLMTTHFPIVVNKDCEYAGTLPTTPENIRNQFRCALDSFIRFIDELKKKGIYDSSLIVLQADHGHGQKIKMTGGESPGEVREFQSGKSMAEIAGSALPLLAVKPPFSQGSLRTSNALVSLADIPATIGSLVGLQEKFDGRSVFEVDPNEMRERRFYYYEWRHEHWQGTFLPRLDEYIIKGSVFNRDSWRLAATYYPRGRTR